jgi:hypothetical protein
MRLRPATLAAAGWLSIGLVTGTAVVAAAAPATFVASASGLGSDPLMAFVNARYALNQQYTGCTDVHVVSSRPLAASWLDVVQGTCTGTA